MATTAGDVLTEVKALLNDPEGYVYGETALLPYLRKALRDLQNKLIANQIQVAYEVTGVVAYVANATSLASPPTDMLFPIALHEKTVGSTELWTPMFKQEWEPDSLPTTMLRYWVWREELIQFLGATQNRSVRIRYVKSLTAIADSNTVIPIVNSQSYLASQTAALAALFIGENPTRALVLNGEAREHMAEMVGTGVRRMQDLPVRRLRNRFRR
jgi:hypothetical protein